MRKHATVLYCVFTGQCKVMHLTKNLVYSFCKEQQKKKKVLSAFDKNPGYVSNPHTPFCRYIPLRPTVRLEI